MARLNKHNAFRSLAAALLMPLLLSHDSLAADDTTNSPQTPVTASTALPDLNTLRQDLLVQIATHGVSMPTYFFIDGILTEEQAQKVKEPGYYVGYKAIIGPRSDGTMRQYFRSGIFEQNCHMYLDEHFDRAQIFSITHETSHHVDWMLGLSATIVDSVYSDPQMATFAPDLFDNREENGGFLFALIKERVADTAAAFYVLSNFEDYNSVKAQMDLRRATMDIEHYAPNFMRVAMENFDQRRYAKLDIVTATKMAAAIVRAHVKDIAADYNGIFAAYQDKAVNKEKDVLNLNASSENPYIIEAKAARNRLCQVQHMAQAKPQ